jgi:hypothetical protein
MEGSQSAARQGPAQILVVANRTAATPGLARAVRRRAAASPCRFTLLIPAVAHGVHKATDPEDQGADEAQAMLELALPVLEDAAGSRVEGRIGDPEPLAAVEDAVNSGDFDEVIVSTLPTRVSRWLHLDLPRKVEGLGLPVTTVTARGREGEAQEG